MSLSRPPQDPLISGPPTWRWPWSRGRDVEIGVRAPRPTVAIEAPTPGKLKAPRQQQIGVEAPGPAGWKVFLVRLALGAAVLYHLAPQIGRVVGPDNARSLLTFLGERMPPVLDVDIGRWFALGAAGWLWQPFLAGMAGVILRIVAYNAARRNPQGAIWIAATALAIDAATWVFMGLKLSGDAWSPAEGAALTTLLKVEAAVLFGLFCLLALTGGKKLGETDAHFNRG